VASVKDDLLMQAIDGDAEALAAVLRREAPAVRQQLAGQIPARWQSVLSVDDVMQETYVDAFLDIARFEPQQESSLTAWLVCIAKRNLLDAIRMLDTEKRGGNWHRLDPPAGDDSFLALFEHLGGSGSTPSRTAARAEARSMLGHALAQLPPAYRQVVETYDLEGRPVEEVAQKLKRTPGAVYMLRARAHRRLAELLGTASQFLTKST